MFILQLCFILKNLNKNTIIKKIFRNRVSGREVIKPEGVSFHSLEPEAPEMETWILGGEWSEILCETYSAICTISNATELVKHKSIQDSALCEAE